MMRSLVSKHCRYQYAGAVVVALAFGSAAACDARSRPGRAQTELDAYSLGGTPLLTIGGQDDRPEYQFQFTVGALRLSDGRVVIADAGPDEVRYYDARGRHLRTVGGSGGGPGEFRNLRSIARIRGDTIVAWDASQRRISFFDTNGDFAASVSLDWTPVQQELQGQFPGSAIAAYSLHVLENAVIIVEPFPNRSPAAMEGTGVIQDTIPLVVFARSGEHAGTLGPFPGAESFYRNRSGSLLRFGERIELAAGTELLYVGSTREPLVRGIATDGEVVRTITLPISRRNVTPEDVPAPGIGPVAALWNAMPVADSMPFFSDIRHGVDGRLWVQKYRASRDLSQEWLAFDESGQLVASLNADPKAELLDIGADYVILLVMDEFDVHEVQMYRLHSEPDARGRLPEPS